jgi:hypothetical protein
LSSSFAAAVINSLATQQIDQQAENFESAMARVAIVTKGPDGAATTNIAGDGFINEDGDMRYNQDGGNRIVVVDRKSVSDYDKTAGTVSEYSLSKHKNRLEPYYRFGFSVPVLRLFQRRMSPALTPYCSEMDARVSPFFTMWLTRSEALLLPCSFAGRPFSATSTYLSKPT